MNIKTNPRVDGRRARGERTRTAIADVLLDLLEGGELDPSADLLAARAGVSRRVIFHHFRDREELLATAAARQLARIRPTLPPLVTSGALAERLDAFVAYRAQILQRIAPTRRVALFLESTSPAIADKLSALRTQHMAEVRAVFAPELEARSRGERSQLEAALAAASSYLFWDQLTTHQRLSPPRAARIMKVTLNALLSRSTP